MYNAYNEKIVIMYEFSWSHEHSLYRVSTVLSSKVQGASNCANNSATDQNLSSELFSRKVICQIEKSAMEASRKVDNMLANTEQLVPTNPVTDRKMLKPKKKFKRKKLTEKVLSPVGNTSPVTNPINDLPVDDAVIEPKLIDVVASISDPFTKDSLTKAQPSSSKVSTKGSRAIKKNNTIEIDTKGHEVIPTRWTRARRKQEVGEPDFVAIGRTQKPLLPLNQRVRLPRKAKS